MALKILISKTRAKINRKLLHLRLQPIRVFCFHQVSEVFDPSTMWECDWTEINQFKRNILKLKEDYIFISLPEAHEKLIHDRFRRKKYAVLTSDDGWASLKNILPWLVEQRVPLTLFVNPDYAEGKAFRESEKEQYLSIKELSSLGVTIGMHGLRHIDVTSMGEADFREYVDESVIESSNITGYIPFWAYTWGRHNAMTDRVLCEKKIVPVYMDGNKNYCYSSSIHRELLS